MNNIEKFNKEATGLMKNIAEQAELKKLIEKKDKDLRAELLKCCEKYGVDKIDNDFVKITKVKESETVSLDMPRLKKSDIYEELLERYPKTTIRKAYLRITPKARKK